MNIKSQFPRTHVGYGVKNIEATVEFYSKFFQVEPVKVKKDYAKFILEEPSLNISFSQSSIPIHPGHIHFGIELDDAEQLRQRLGSAMSHELSIDEEKEVKCCYAKQDKFWVTDPDGYRWEVFVFKEDVDENDKANSEVRECCAA
ncbi:MAG: ArsI/CadI family heavy metal resistance metalloenzyme [Bacteroidota bacterium]